MNGKICFLDVETAGLRLEQPIIQVAAIAVGGDWQEIETLNRLIVFDEAKADAEALAINHYDREVWKREARPEAAVVAELGGFLKRHSTQRLTSQRTGKEYTVARVAGHNIASFDLERVAAMFKRHGTFFAIDFRSVLDTRYGAVWLFEGGAAAEPPTAQPKNFKLTGLAEHFGIPTEGAHDALFDVRLSIALARRIVELWQRPAREVA